MPATATPTEGRSPMRLGNFRCLAEALDYASGSGTGHNFYTTRGELAASVTYGELREQALSLARRLGSLGLARGERVALVADTTPEFSRVFFACQYAGLTPVPVSAALRLGGTVTAEHGIGLARRDYLPLQVGEDVVGVMRRIKSALDPQNILNPGRVL